MDGRGPLIVRLRRLGGRVPPPDNEHLDVAPDGEFSMWRSTNTGVAGRFAGHLDPAELAGLVAEASEASAAGDLEVQPFPDASLETIEVQGARAELGGDTEGAWAPLVARLHRLLDELTAAPLAAIALEVDQGGRRARLVHRGSDPLRLDLSGLASRAVLWGPNWWLLQDWRSGTGEDGRAGAAGGAGAGAGAGAVEAGPSWSLELPFAHGFEPGPDRTLQGFAELVLIEREIPVSVGLMATSPFSGAPG
jgi:hypothetical protein